VLHGADDLRELARPDRILVVDEAFMDAVPGEPESLAGASIPGLVVVRSLTKTWGLAGLRVGYVLAGASLIEQLAAVQPHWPVSTPALSAAIACSNERAVAEAAQAALDIEQHRVHLIDKLGTVNGLSTYGVARAPFVLVHVAGAAEVRESLRTQGFAVRRGDTFPGLGPDWIRIAVRPEDVTDGLVKVLADLLR
jgi:histidinol-phosphate aminotransferase